LPGEANIVVMAISGFLFLHHLYGWRLLRFISEGTTHHPVTMDRIIIIMILIEPGSQATGKIGGPPMVGKGSGFQAIGNMAPNEQKIA
jgi:hypothetical protein